MLDYDEDGWMDLFVANDTQPNKLYRNNHDGTLRIRRQFPAWLMENRVQLAQAWEPMRVTMTTRGGKDWSLAISQMKVLRSTVTGVRDYSQMMLLPPVSVLRQ